MKKLLFSITILTACLQLQAQSWSLTGNSGTTPGTNFLGTKDAKALVFKVNKQQSGYIDFDGTKANTYFGFQAAKNNKGVENTAFGYTALYTNATGNYNTAIGESALYFNYDGKYNTATGKDALYNNTSGSYNTAHGYFALGYNKTGSYNTANGYCALLINDVGQYNTANGYYSMYLNKSGTNNTANGAYSLYSNTSGHYNVAEGFNVMANNTTGLGNTAVGYNALTSTKTSYFNTAIGFEAGDSYDNGYNNVFVGANVDVNGAGYYNDIAIGQGTVCTDVSQVTIGNSATSTYRVYANWSNISDGRFKKNIKENVPGLVFINKLQPVTYTLDATGIDNFLHKDQPQDKQISGQAKALLSKALATKEKTFYTGFIAQDVEKAAKSLNYDFSGLDAAKNDKDLYGLRYADFVVPLVKAVQELSKQNDSLQKQINELKTLIVTNNPLAISSQSAIISSTFLSQNLPNPFNHSTTINYTIPQTYSSAKIIITDNLGKNIKTINISGTNGSVNVDASTLSSGTYHYTLYIDGRMIDSKQMLLTK